MHPIHRQLYTDHNHLQRLLDWFQRQIDSYEAQDQEQQVELLLILDALDYIRVYPEKWHHPMEEIIFAVLLNRQPAEMEILVSTKVEHRDLELLTQELNQLFNAVANDCVVPIDQLVEKSRRFLRQQNAHIRLENERVYPLFERLLSPDDWRRIEQVAGERNTDPLFGELAKADYENLYRHIMEIENKTSDEST